MFSVLTLGLIRKYKVAIQQNKILMANNSIIINYMITIDNNYLTVGCGHHIPIISVIKPTYKFSDEQSCITLN